jgi:hypothetical protein
VPSPTSPRNPLTRARFFLAQAEASSGFEQEALENFVQAAIIFGQSVVADFRKSPDSISETPQADEPRTGRTSLAA